MDQCSWRQSLTVSPFVRQSSRIQKLGGAVLFVLLAAGTVLALLNLDLLMRTWRSYQNATLTMEKFRLDLGSYNLGKDIPPIPDNARISPQDGMVQLFVAAGEFIMGDGSVEERHHNAPAHTVYLDAYWIDRVEVTNSMYLKCMEASGCTAPVSDNIVYDTWEYRNHPIVYINWFQADEYCRWAGRRLPTEAEWEKAARGPDGFKYPWGNDPPTPRLANFDQAMIHEAVPAYRYPLGASPYGALNMAGNVREWVYDWFDRDYYRHTPSANPRGPESGEERSLRSGSYNEDRREITAYQRYNHEPQSAGLSRGFRCAQDADE